LLVFYLAALDYVAEGDQPRAQVGFGNALKFDPTLAIAHFGLGHLAEERGAWKEAIEHYEKVDRLAPGSPLARRTAVDLEYARGRLTGADR
jgi:Tfp pilus assembly protein PilF